MLVTLFTDASVHPQLETAGWGAWIKGDERPSKTFSGPLQTHRGPGMLPRFEGSSGLAELMAIAEALIAAEASGYFQPIDDGLLVQSDSTQALGVLLSAVPGAGFTAHSDGVQQVNGRIVQGPHERDAAEAFKTLVAKLELRLLLRHVRGHTAGGNRNWVNRKCDDLAYGEARKAAGIMTPHARRN